MPFISQEFTHTLESYDAAPLYFHYKNPKDNLMSSVDQACIEASQLFFNDLKSMLEETDLEISFSENLEYISDNTIAMPSFNFHGLDLSPVVVKVCTHANTITMLPFMVRHYTSLGVSSYRPYSLLGSITNENIVGYKGRINKSKVQSEYEISYTIEIYYNTDFLIINYRPYEDKTIKFTICCLIKGVDINDKVVLYESGGCNTYMGTTSATSLSVNDFSWNVYHRLSWADSPYLNPYTGEVSYPTENHNYSTRHDADISGQDLIFLDLCNNKSTVHDSGIKRVSDSPNDVVLYRPYCCRGNVVFSDNILTGPISLSLDTIYVVNGEEYYCPGDYTSIMESISSGSSHQDTRTMRFLLKL